MFDGFIEKILLQYSIASEEFLFDINFNKYFSRVLISFGSLSSLYSSTALSTFLYDQLKTAIIPATIRNIKVFIFSTLLVFLFLSNKYNHPMPLPVCFHQQVFFSAPLRHYGYVFIRSQNNLIPETKIRSPHFHIPSYFLKIFFQRTGLRLA